MRDIAEVGVDQVSCLIELLESSLEAVVGGYIDRLP
jgi:hypothetical protein